MWTPDALRSEIRACDLDIWRAVEAQHKASTMRLTDTLEEQALLEEILERSKPAFPKECVGFHYLLYTPFRYTPYPRGSRFRRAGQTDGVFYGSEKVDTAIAEIAFYRLLFFAESPDAISPSLPVEHTVFAVGCATARHIDLTAPPLDRDAKIWTAPSEYGACQQFADTARGEHIEIIRYQSVRDPNRGINCAVLSPGAFTERRPKGEQSWHIFPGVYGVRAWCENPKMSLEFGRGDFNNDPRLSAVAVPDGRVRRRRKLPTPGDS